MEPPRTTPNPVNPTNETTTANPVNPTNDPQTTTANPVNPTNDPQTTTPNPANPTNDTAIIEVIEEEGNQPEEPAKQRTRGGKKIGALLLVNQALATLAFFGVAVNLVLFLTRVLRQDNAAAANNVSKWTGTVYMFSLVGAFFSDSYWGRYLTCIIFQIFFILGLALLSVTSWVFLVKPAGCGTETGQCKPASTAGSVLFYFSIYLVALGYGGHQPTLATFGGDQYDEKIPKEKTSKEAFFCYFYFALNCGSLFSNTILVHYEDTGKWTLGFMVSLGSAVLAFLSFLAGTPWFKYLKPSGNPIARVSQVFVAAVRKWNVKTANADELYEVEGTESAIKGSRKILHSDEFRFLDKAATSTQEDTQDPKRKWRLCTVTQVEEAKCVLRMLPVWLCTIIYSVVFTQMASTFVEQGQLEFFNGQAPDGIKSFGSSLCMASMAIGNYVSSLIVSIVMAITARGDNPGWIPSNLNVGHLDRFFFLIAGLSAVDFVIYVISVKWYKGINNVEEEDNEKETDTGEQRNEAVVSEA
ncbi:hypothetical protein L6164_000658 [Bauhinia variegata]|uniref:Uncharacterized protein n=2 Tax=Bauhinia variegata TaxID=167791 RepID=A0ACB9Q7A2_BAUVA|nr:hypothetical protein L6164_000658 [Bauhinia variegata]